MILKQGYNGRDERSHGRQPGRGPEAPGSLERQDGGAEEQESDIQRALEQRAGGVLGGRPGKAEHHVAAEGEEGDEQRRAGQRAKQSWLQYHVQQRRRRQQDIEETVVVGAVADPEHTREQGQPAEGQDPVAKRMAGGVAKAGQSGDCEHSLLNPVAVA